ncbi:efflux RND transporter permease subunit [Frigoriglobus tundricola]|uniref:RND efflux system, inner membrane transporter n=1 Tax=Frigoriglobus tundricola TaxID=2774151 RepID=A0A6M5YJM5_9BACT|nr:efflux RND transporter permease subunit [Frigoriglobus tundricola]QJW93182.1 RND efflux system, inner membrane transporter [Frigoriglobus tundricola]
MISHFFIDRPIFASVLSIVITLAGAVAVFTLPIAQYPDVTPPTVVVTGVYPGANAITVRDTVAAPIEEQVSGVEGMLYMSSQCTNDGTFTLTVTFKLGTNADMAQVLVQNRVSLALPVVPLLVQREGIMVKKQSPNTLMIVNLVSKNGRYRDLELSNYATIEIRDELGRLPGIAGVGYLGQRDYSIRAWLDPLKLASLNLTAADVVNAIGAQNIQVAAGQIGQQPTPKGQQFQLTINTLGRLIQPEQFADIIIKVGQGGSAGAQAAMSNSSGSGTGGSGSGGANGSGQTGSTDQSGTAASPAGQSAAIVRLRDVVSPRREIVDATGAKQFVGGVELGAQQYDQSSTLDGKPTVALTLYGLPGANAIDTATGVYKKMEDLKKRFPEGMDYEIVYDTTPFIRQSVNEVFKTLRDAIILVAIVVLVFLQSWRAALIPLVAVPVAVIGTFAVMAAFKFSLNNLTLFGLVLAIGIVVDDAIVVVENVERWLEHGLEPRDAARKAMEEVTGPVIAIALVLTAVFVPCAFIGGVTGAFFRQFAVTIAFSTLISAFNSLTLSPALCALLLRPKTAPKDAPTRALDFALGWFFRLFNRAFGAGTEWYARVVGWVLRLTLIVLAVYGGLLVLTYHEFTSTPTGFVPQQDKGYLILNVQLPDSASADRTQQAMARIEAIARDTPGVDHTVGISGQSLILNANAPNLGSMYIMLKPFAQRTGADQTADAIGRALEEQCQKKVRGAEVRAFGAPPIEGLGTTGGFKIMIEDRGNLGLEDLQRRSDEIVRDGNATPGFQGLFSSARFNTPWVYLDIDRTKCAALGLAMDDVFNALQYNLGSYYVNNFNEFGRNWQVNVQADPQFRERVREIGQLQVRNNQGAMVQLRTVMSVRDTSGPVLLQRYNMYTAAAITGTVAPGTSTGEIVPMMKAITDRDLPQSMAADWTELTFLQNEAGNSAAYAFVLAVVFVFLVLAAQYESWKLPLAVILVVPMCLLFAVIGVNVVGQDITIFTQIGLIVLVGLACKNAILIVEFAKQRQEEGMSEREAAVEASRQRLRPILMTSFAFILGVVPLVIAEGAGFEMRRSLGIAVFSGMLGVTLFGIFLTPVFFYAIQSVGWSTKKPAPRKPQPNADHPGPDNGKPHSDPVDGKPGTPSPSHSDSQPSSGQQAPGAQPAG